MIKKWTVATLQIAGLTLFSLAAKLLAEWMHLPVPGSILGMVLLFLLLEAGIVRMSWVDLGASLLLAELLLFFVPSAIGVMKYGALLESDGLRVLAVVLAGTFVVMSSSGLLAGAIYKVKERKMP